MKERRCESRYLCADLVRVDWMISGGDFRSIEAVLEDISPVGACVQVEEPVELGTTLVLTIDKSHFAGHVCYCGFRDYGYFVGIRFSEETEWTSEIVLPQHLTDLRTIARQAKVEMGG
jgi:hypothetical protein